MRILFVRSGNNGIDPISTLQGQSLSQLGVEIFYFDVIGRGFFGYLKNIRPLRKYIKDVRPDIVHAHYSFCGFISLLTFSGFPIITSLMGSDINSDKIFRGLIKLCSLMCWKEVIVKSREMKEKIRVRESRVIPNGVDVEKFYVVPKNEARDFLNWELEKKIILFAANPCRYEKNWPLAKLAIENLNRTVDVKTLTNISIEEMVYHYNGADVILLTSLWEGSPNVIKEAMACNCPIVTTDVGDVRKIIGGTKGCFVVKQDAREIAKKLNDILSSNNRTEGRNRIIKKGLDSNTVAMKLIEIYETHSKIS